jgi:hypothetical protein
MAIYARQKAQLAAIFSGFYAGLSNPETACNHIDG